MTNKPTLDDFERWCNGYGRGGKEAGVHYSTIDAIQRYRLFLANKAKKLKG